MSRRSVPDADFICNPICRCARWARFAGTSVPGYRILPEEKSKCRLAVGQPSAAGECLAQTDPDQPTLVLVRTTPPHQSGSMAAYAEMVLAAIRASDACPFTVQVLEAHSGSLARGMWRQHVWRFRNMKRKMRACGPVWFHLLDGSMAAFVPRELRARTLVTVHDLIPLLGVRGKLPIPRPSWLARQLVRESAEALRECIQLCAVSQQTAKDCEHWLGRHDLPVINLAVRSLPQQDMKSSLPNPYVLHIGHNAAYKNRSGVIDIFERLRQSHPELHLMMAGAPPTESLQRRAEEVKQVQFVVDPSDQKLSALYRHAAFFLFPSLYEGFGMPVLEAMALGCPVVCSTAGSLPEIAGDAALLAPVDRVEGFVQHGSRLIRDAGLREQLRQKGKAHAVRFTLNRMGQELIQWYGDTCIC